MMLSALLLFFRIVLTLVSGSHRYCEEQWRTSRGAMLHCAGWRTTVGVTPML